MRNVQMKKLSCRNVENHCENCTDIHRKSENLKREVRNFQIPQWDGKKT